MHAESGAPPLEAWLHQYISAPLEVPYYVGLLSAAETYGIAPYAVTVTQVMVPMQRRPVTVGRQQLAFHTRTNITAMPTQWHETPEGRFRVPTVRNAVEPSKILRTVYTGLRTSARNVAVGAVRSRIFAI
jgi:hypothetical protein